MKASAIAALVASSLALAPALADASVPAVLGQQGRLFDEEGQPIDGDVRVVYALYEAAAGGEPRWSEAQTLVVEDGYFTTTLGSTTPLDAAVFADGRMYLSLTIEDDEEMTPRAQLVSVPFALLANDAIGDIHPKSVTVGGTLVIDEEGNWIGDVAGMKGDTGDTGPAGPTGAAGATGPQGTAGAAGAAGPQGAVGPQGDVGAVGPQGPQGNVGAVGPQGDVGAVGPQGPAGSDGAIGPQGPAGSDGAIGPQGPAGSDGAIGPQGPQGVEGANGLDGATGPMGPQGPEGSNGLDGATGPMGPQGVQGLTGPAGSGSSATYRYVTFDTFDEGSWTWMSNNDAAVFGGVQPSAWSDGNATAGMVSANKDVQRGFFINQGHARSANAMVASESEYVWNSTGGRHVAVLFRVRNTTGSDINWPLNMRYTAYSSWGETTSVALNGVNLYATGTTNHIGTSVVMTVPANRVSTVIVVAGSGQYSGDNRALHLSFGNNSLALPAGLETVDDLDTAVGGYEQ